MVPSMEMTSPSRIGSPPRTFARYNGDPIVAFGKNVHGNGFSKSFFYGIIAKFFYKLFGSSAGFGEVMQFCLRSMLFFLFAKC